MKWYFTEEIVHNCIGTIYRQPTSNTMENLTVVPILGVAGFVSVQESYWEAKQTRREGAIPRRLTVIHGYPVSAGSV